MQNTHNSYYSNPPLHSDGGGGRGPSFSVLQIYPEGWVHWAHWEAYGRGSLPLHHLVSDSANPQYVSDPLPKSFTGSP